MVTLPTQVPKLLVDSESVTADDSELCLVRASIKEKREARRERYKNSVESFNKHSLFPFSELLT